MSSGNSEDNPGNNSAPTRPFSDRADVLHRVIQTRAEFLKTTDRDPTPLPPTELEIREIAKTFDNAPLASMPEVRLVIASLNSPGTGDPAVVHLPHTAGGWEMMSVQQRTSDVNFPLHLPFFIPPSKYPYPRFIPHRLCCDIVYDPATDNCLLINHSPMEIRITGIDPTASQKVLGYGQPRVMNPGVWRISVKGEKSSTDQPVADILVLRKRFSVTIHETPSISSSAKRPSTVHEAGDFKRRRTGDTTEVLIAQAAHPTAGGPETNTSNPATSIALTTAARDIVHTGGTPLWDLMVGELAVIQRPSTSAISTSLVARDTRSALGPASYELRRLDLIAETRSARVFTSRHSALSENVVAKIMRYEKGEPAELISCANNWKREKGFLEKLNHVGNSRLGPYVFDLYPNSCTMSKLLNCVDS